MINIQCRALGANCNTNHVARGRKKNMDWTCQEWSCMDTKRREGPDYVKMWKRSGQGTRIIKVMIRTLKLNIMVTLSLVKL